MNSIIDEQNIFREKECPTDGILFQSAFKRYEKVVKHIEEPKVKTLRPFVAFEK